MSAAHFRSGISATNCRSSTLSATGCSCLLSVVRGTNFFLPLARTPCSAITFATVFSQACSPDAASARWTRGLPYTPRLACLVHRLDLLRQLRPTLRPRAGRPAAPRVIPRATDLEDLAGDLQRV